MKNLFKYSAYFIGILASLFSATSCGKDDDAKDDMQECCSFTYKDYYKYACEDDYDDSYNSWNEYTIYWSDAADYLSASGYEVVWRCKRVSITED